MRVCYYHTFIAGRTHAKPVAVRLISTTIRWPTISRAPELISAALGERTATFADQTILAIAIFTWKVLLGNKHMGDSGYQVPTNQTHQFWCVQVQLVFKLLQLKVPARFSCFKNSHGRPTEFVSRETNMTISYRSDLICQPISDGDMSWPQPISAFKLTNRQWRCDAGTMPCQADDWGPTDEHTH